MYIKLKNTRIHYKIFGSGDNLVFLPGWGRSFEDYAAVVNHLAKKFRVIAIDLPGFGLSPVPPALWQTPQYAECVKDLLTALNITQPILVGHSFGGKISLFLTAQNMVVPKKLLLISSAGIRRHRTPKQNLKIYSFKALKNLVNLPVLNFLFAGKLEIYRKKIGSQDYRSSQGLMRKILVRVIQEDFKKMLPAVRVPTLLILGALDDSVPLVNGKLMHELIPNSKMVIFEDAGHHPHDQDFGKFCKEADNFLIQPAAPTQKISE